MIYTNRHSVERSSLEHTASLTAHQPALAWEGMGEASFIEQFNSWST